MPTPRNEEELALSSAELLAYEASEVQVLLKKEIVKAAFQATEQQIVTEWENATNPLSREMCWHELQAFKKLRRKLLALAERQSLHLAKG